MAPSSTQLSHVSPVCPLSTVQLSPSRGHRVGPADFCGSSWWGSSKCSIGREPDFWEIERHLPLIHLTINPSQIACSNYHTWQLHPRKANHRLKVRSKTASPSALHAFGHLIIIIIMITSASASATWSHTRHLF